MSQHQHAQAAYRPPGALATAQFARYGVGAADVEPAQVQAQPQPQEIEQTSSQVPERTRSYLPAPPDVTPPRTSLVRGATVLAVVGGAIAGAYAAPGAALRGAAMGAAGVAGLSNLWVAAQERDPNARAASMILGLGLLGAAGHQAWSLFLSRPSAKDTDDD